MSALKAQRMRQPVLADIENLPEILHFLADDKGKNVLPDLLGRMTKTEESLRGHTDALKLPSGSSSKLLLPRTWSSSAMQKKCLVVGRTAGKDVNGEVGLRRP